MDLYPLSVRRSLLPAFEAVAAEVAAQAAEKVAEAEARCVLKVFACIDKTKGPLEPLQVQWRPRFNLDGAPLVPLDFSAFANLVHPGPDGTVSVRKVFKLDASVKLPQKRIASALAELRKVINTPLGANWLLRCMGTVCKTRADWQAFMRNAQTLITDPLPFAAALVKTIDTERSETAMVVIRSQLTPATQLLCRGAKTYWDDDQILSHLPADYMAHYARRLQRDLVDVSAADDNMLNWMQLPTVFFLGKSLRLALN